MVTELNKLVSNTLIKNGGITLSSVGSLRVVASSPKAGSQERTIRVVEFAPGDGMRTLESVISEMGHCTEAQAQVVYSKWLDEVRTSDGVKIDGVGQLCGERFTVDEKLNLRLNPTVEVKRKRGNRAVWVAVAVAAVVAVVAGGAYLFQTSDEVQQDLVAEEVITPAAMPPASADIDSEMMISPEQEEAGVAEAKERERLAEEAVKKAEAERVAALKSESKSAKKSHNIGGLLGDALSAAEGVSDRPFRVICGVFTTEHYANKTISEVQSKLGKSYQCTAYVEGDKYFLSLYDTSTQREALDFAKQKQGLFNEKLWVSRNKY